MPMKTTLDISDALAEEAKAVARAQQTTFRALVERGLENVLREARQAKPFVMQDCSVGGQGLQPGQSDLAWDELRDMIYEGRGA